MILQNKHRILLVIVTFGVAFLPSYDLYKKNKSMTGIEQQSQNRQEYKNEFDRIVAMLKKVSEKQEEQSDTLSDMNLTLSQLNQTVVGNKTYGQKGLVEEVSDIKIYVEKEKIFKNKVAGGLIIIGVVWTFFLKYFENLLSLKK